MPLKGFITFSPTPRDQLLESSLGTAPVTSWPMSLKKRTRPLRLSVTICRTAPDPDILFRLTTEGLVLDLDWSLTNDYVLAAAGNAVTAWNAHDGKVLIQ